MDTISRLVFEHRRLLASAFTALAVLTSLSVLTRSPDGTQMLVAGRDLRSGEVISADDLRTVFVPKGAQPARALGRDSAIGRRVAGPMRAGEPLTDFRVLEPGSLGGYDEGSVLTTVRVDQVEGLNGLRVGDRINIIAVDPNGESAATMVARGVEIAILPPAEDDSDDVAVGIVTTEKIALTLAEVGLEARFSVISSS